MFLGTTAAGLLLPVSSLKAAAGDAIARQAVFKHDLPPINLEDWQVNAVELTFPPGVSAAKHRHPGFVIGYVLEGEFRFQMFYEAPERIHLVSASASTTRPARVLALVFGKRGEPVSTPAGSP